MHWKPVWPLREDGSPLVLANAMHIRNVPGRRAQFLRRGSSRGPTQAIGAVAASMRTAAYDMRRDQVAYRDRGGDHVDRTDNVRTTRRLIRKVGDLGFTVEVKDSA